MPYIKDNMRDRVSPDLEKIIDNVRTFNEEQKDGVLNYIFTIMLAGSFDNESYLTYQRKVGILECCKLELYRSRVAPYEEKKKEENGDAFYKAFRIK
jgi:hypothetical protein